MLRRAALAGFSLLLLFPALALGQGRATKVSYDQTVVRGSQALQRLESTYFEILTTPSAEDPDAALLRYWAPRLDAFFRHVADNLCLTRPEVYRYLLFPKYFAELEKLQIEGLLTQANIDSLARLCIDMFEEGAPRPVEPLVFVGADPKQVADCAPGFLRRPASGGKRRYGDCVTVSGDTVSVLLPGPQQRYHQRCVLYRTLADFMASPIGPVLPEGVLGFVPTLDPQRPVVLYASLGEHQLRRTAQHEIGHAVVEGIAVYLRSLDVTRMLRAHRAPKDSAGTRPWSPASGGFSGITHENFAEYLAFPRGQMDPALRAALVEMVAENRLDGLAAISVGARTIASSYIEGPARLVFLAEHFGDDFPKRLLVTYYTGSRGFLDTIETLTGKSMSELEQLYKRWLRQSFWSQSLAADIPDTMGTILCHGWSGVRRDGQVLLSRARDGRQELVLVTPPALGHGKAGERVLARDLDGIERLPLFSTPDLRHGRVVAVARKRNEESLLLWDAKRGVRLRCLSDLGAIREISNPRLSPSGEAVVCRVVDRSGRNGIAYLNLETDHARVVVPLQWPEVFDPSFAESETRVLFAATTTSDHTSDVFLHDVTTGATCNLTRSPGRDEVEPLLVNGRLLCLADVSGVYAPTVLEPGRAPRRLANLPFPIDRMQHSDSTLTLVAHSLRHEAEPAGRAVWEFPLRRLGLGAKTAATAGDDLDRLAAPGRGATVSAGTPTSDSIGAESADLAPNPGPVALTASDAAEADATRLSADAGQGVLQSPGLLALGLSPAVTNTVAAVHGSGPGRGTETPNALPVTSYKQKWRLLPLGINLLGGGLTSAGVSMMGFDTEFHDQSVVIAAGQGDRLDRFGLLQYRNSAARTHWQASGYYRSVLRGRYTETGVEDRTESETGVLLTAQYHQSLVTRFGLGLAATRRNDVAGSLQRTDPQPGPLQARAADTAPPPALAPLLGMRFPGLHPSAWRLSVAGLSDLAMLCDRSPAALAAWSQAQRAGSEQLEFLPSREYARPNLTLGASMSHDTRVFADYRGPHSGSLFVVEMSGGANAPGTRTFLNAAHQDSTSQRIAGGLDRLSASWVYLSHRRVSCVDLAFRFRGLLNSGPEALVYGLGGLYSVAGYSDEEVRSRRIAWTNAEARVQIWNYSTWNLPVKALVFPAADCFLFGDSGVAQGSNPLFSSGVGLRLRLGFLAFEWRRPFAQALANQRGLTFVW